MSFNKLNPRRISCLVISLTMYRIFTNLPLIFTRNYGTGAPLFSLILGIIVTLFIVFFLSKFSLWDKKNIIDIAQSTFGGLGKYILSVLSLIYIFISSAYLLSEFSEFIKLVAFPSTPLWFIAIFFAVAAALGALSSLDALVKILSYFLPVFLAILFFLLGSVLWQSDFSNLFPVLGTASGKNISNGFSGTIMFSDLLLLFLIFPSSAERKVSKRLIISSAVIGIIAVFLVVLSYTAKIPYPLSKEESFPLYLLVKEVYYGRFFQRIDAAVLLIAALWGMSALSFNLYLILKIMKESFGVGSFKVSAFPVTVTVFLAALFLSSKFSQISTRLLQLSAAALCASFIITGIFARKKVPLADEN